MLAVMKRKAVEAEARGEGAFNDRPNVEFREILGRPMYNSMMKKLINYLKPTQISLEDESSQHAGHSGNSGSGTESHFRLKIVADCFKPLSLVQRHKLIYTLLAEEMTEIHALSIDAKAPEEVQA
jgi:stress-induced morphogen